VKITTCTCDGCGKRLRYSASDGEDAATIQLWVTTREFHGMGLSDRFFCLDCSPAVLIVLNLDGEPAPGGSLLSGPGAKIARENLRRWHRPADKMPFPDQQVIGVVGGLIVFAAYRGEGYDRCWRIDNGVNSYETKIAPDAWCAIPALDIEPKDPVQQ
jgi:hypothetical protein